MGERLGWEELVGSLYFLTIWAVAVTFYTELMLEAIERKRRELDGREYWRSLWQFPKARHR
ncbi:MAG TPA: hypothetical protein VFD42_05130 [Chloroflexota bacterium]|nr:hypothetical protein [Chloroflexota bacterium]